MTSMGVSELMHDGLGVGAIKLGLLFRSNHVSLDKTASADICFWILLRFIIMLVSTVFSIVKGHLAVLQLVHDVQLVGEWALQERLISNVKCLSQLLPCNSTHLVVKNP